MISITYTNDCAKKPRCSFCYLKKQSFLNKLLEKEQGTFDIWKHDRLIAQAEQVAIGYNGVELYNLIIILVHLRSGDLIVNITTSPEFVSEHLVALFKNLGVAMVALSLDPEKGNLKEWLKVAKLLQRKNLLIGANILMLDEVYHQLPNILKKIGKECPAATQIHLLRPKFYKSKIPLEKRKEMIFLLKQKYKNLFIDQCFRFEFQGFPCTRGKDFISINADNSRTFCSFDLTGEAKVDLKKCPYI